MSDIPRYACDCTLRFDHDSLCTDPLHNRYLTSERKMAVLHEWSWKQRTFRGGHAGDPDPDMISWCARINAFSGICTLQSCAGHRDADGIMQNPGHLWLWMNEAMSQAFDASAFDLACHRNIERVERLYTSWGQEVTSITFAGNERDHLAESMQVILLFLRKLEQQTTCNRRSV